MPPHRQTSLHALPSQSSSHPFSDVEFGSQDPEFDSHSSSKRGKRFCHLMLFLLIIGGPIVIWSIAKRSENQSAQNQSTDDRTSKKPQNSQQQQQQKHDNSADNDQQQNVTMLLQTLPFGIAVDGGSPRHCHGFVGQDGECLFRAFSSCGKSRTVSLTFDDGPSRDPDNTLALLNELDAYGIPATFFATPAQDGESEADLNARCALIREIMSERDVQHSVQGHSWDHPDLTALDRAQFSFQIGRTREFLLACGAQPTQFRPPFGKILPEQAMMLGEQGTVLALWNVEPADDGDPGDADVIFDKITSQFEKEVGVGHSSVILLHDTRYALRHGLISRIHAYFSELEYEFVTSEQCYDRCGAGVCVDAGGPREFQGVFRP